MAQMTALYDRAGLIALEKLMKQLESFPDSAATTKLTRETVRFQETEDEWGSKKKIPAAKYR